MFRKYMYDIIELNGIDRYYTSDEITEDLYLDNDEIKNWELWSYDFEFYRGVKVLSSYEDKLIFTIACLCEACYIQPILKKLDKIGYKYIINYKPLKLDTTVRGVYSDNYGNILSFDKLKFVNKNWCYFDKKKNKYCKAKSLGLYDFIDYGNLKPEVKKMLPQYLKDKNITLEEFLMNKKYIVIADGDESDWTRLIDFGVICKDHIKSEFKVFSENPIDDSFFL